MMIPLMSEHNTHSVTQIQQLISEMKEIYNSAKICPYGQKPFDPHVERTTSTAAGRYYPAGGYPETSFDQMRAQSVSQNVYHPLGSSFQQVGV